MHQKNVFMDWLTDNKLSLNTAGKYAGAINTISEELRLKKIIEGSLYNITDPVIIETLTIRYFSIPEYKAKNDRGNNMYSNSLRHFKNFIEYSNN